MLTFPSAVRIFIYTQPTDMRSGFARLTMLVEQFMRHDPFEGHLFVFFNRTGDKCKILFWDRTGFVLWYKRLEEGTFERLRYPPNAASLEIDVAGLSWILEGIDLLKARRRKRYHRQKEEK
jgi:transposase